MSTGIANGKGLFKLTFAGGLFGLEIAGVPAECLARDLSGLGIAWSLERDKDLTRRFPRVEGAPLEEARSAASLAETDDGVAPSDGPGTLLMLRNYGLRFDATPRTSWLLFPPIGDISIPSELMSAMVAWAVGCDGGLALHGCAFRVMGQNVLAVGPSHSGKSTLAACALAAGGVVVSDDSVVVSRGNGGEILGHVLRQELAFREETLTTFSGSMRDALRQSDVRRTEDGRYRADFLSARAITIEPTCLWVPSIDRERATCGIDVMSKADALVAVIKAGGIWALPDSVHRLQTEAFRMASELVDRLPVYRVFLGTSLLVEPTRELERLIAAVKDPDPRA